MSDQHQCWPDMIWHQVMWSHLATYKTITALKMCGSTVYIVTVSTSLLVVYHKVGVKYYSWGTPADLVQQPIAGCSVNYALQCTLYCTVLCIVNGQSVQSED